MSLSLSTATPSQTPLERAQEGTNDLISLIYNSESYQIRNNQRLLEILWQNVSLLESLNKRSSSEKTTKETQETSAEFKAQVVGIINGLEMELSSFNATEWAVGCRRAAEMVEKMGWGFVSSLPRPTYEQTAFFTAYQEINFRVPSIIEQLRAGCEDDSTPVPQVEKEKEESPRAEKEKTPRKESPIVEHSGAGCEDDLTSSPQPEKAKEKSSETEKAKEESL